MIKRLFGCCAWRGFKCVLVLVWRYIRSTCLRSRPECRTAWGWGSRWHLTGVGGVVRKALFGAGASEQSFWSQSRSASVFLRASGRVAESPHETGRKVLWLFDCRPAPENVGQVGTGRAPARMESCRSSPVSPPPEATAGVSVTGSADFSRNGTSRRVSRSSNRRRLRRLSETADKIAQRFKSLEMAVSDHNWE